MFEDKALADQAVVAVEKAVHHEDMDSIAAVDTKNVEVGHTEIVEQIPEKASKV